MVMYATDNKTKTLIIDGEEVIACDDKGDFTIVIDTIYFFPFINVWFAQRGLPALIMLNKYQSTIFNAGDWYTELDVTQLLRLRGDTFDQFDALTEESYAMHWWSSDGADKELVPVYNNMGNIPKSLYCTFPR